MIGRPTQAYSIPKEKVISAIETGGSYRRAAQLLRISGRTFRKIATAFGIYHPKSHSSKKIPLDEILKGLHPQYPTSHLNRRLVKEGLKEYRCEACGITEWNGKKISLELNHKDGDGSNHVAQNLELLCPNCHSQTSTFRSKNRFRKVGRVDYCAELEPQS